MRFFLDNISPRKENYAYNPECNMKRQGDREYDRCVHIKNRAVTTACPF